DVRESLSEDVDPSADSGGTSSTPSPRAACPFQHVANLKRELRVRLLSRPSELLNERIIRPGINVVGREHTGVTAGALHFGFQPFEVFTGTGVVRENIDGLLDRNGPELLQ